jgi:hypothetical protein
MRVKDKTKNISEDFPGEVVRLAGELYRVVARDRSNMKITSAGYCRDCDLALRSMGCIGLNVGCGNGGVIYKRLDPLHADLLKAAEVCDE